MGIEMKQNCKFKTHMGVNVEAEAIYVPGFRKYPSIFYQTEGGHMIEVTFGGVKEFRTYLKMLVRLDEEIGVEDENN